MKSISRTPNTANSPRTMPKILVIDDDRHICETIQSLLARLNYQYRAEHTITDGLKALQEDSFDVVFLDIRLPDGNGLTALPQIRSTPDAPEVIILTGEGDPDGAELAIQGGVWDFLVKPTPIKQTTLTLKRALQYREEKQSKGSAPVALNLENVIGSSDAMRTCFNLVAQAAMTDANVLITGETGTGKELTARTVHANSLRRNNRFVVVDCAALTETLVESTLFGHKKGAFTGAQQDQDGLVKVADKGTLFLDEVGEMPLSIQKSFLRFLQERVFRPVGGTQEIKSDFRLISATNKNLDEMVERGEFRKDLLFRLKTMHIELPPLRLRCEDVKPLAMFYINRLCEQYGVPNKGFSSDFFTMLSNYEWPGNVRELFNVLERAFVASGMESMLYAMHLPQDLRIKIAKANLTRGGSSHAAKVESPVYGITPQAVPAPGRSPAPADGNASYSLSGKKDTATCGDSLLDGPIPELKDFKNLMERKYIEAIIAQTDGNVQEIIRLSGLSRSHFYALLKKNNITL